MSKNVHDSIIYNTEKLETTNSSIIANVKCLAKNTIYLWIEKNWLTIEYDVCANKTKLHQ